MSAEKEQAQLQTDAQPPVPSSLTAKVFGDASAQAEVHPDQVEGSRKDLPKADVVPEHVKAIPAANAEEVPRVADGDEERATDPGVMDLGWSEDPRIPIPVLHGLKNEDVWQLVRRFNKQTYHLKALKPGQEPQGGIDVNIADKDEFTPDKLRSTLERLYMTIGLGLAAFFKHIARLRSWKEYKRTTVFLVAYLIGWVLNYPMTVLFTLLTILLASPRSRRVLFPPAPLAAISAKTGEARVPKAGHLGSESLTGAAESYKGEAVEQEATNLVGSVAHMAVSTAIGNDSSKVQHHNTDDGDQGDVSIDDDATEAEVDGEKRLAKEEENTPDPASMALASKDAQSKVKGDKKHADNQKDHSAEAVHSSVWAGAQPLLHALEDVADTWERFGNALSPTPPFAQHRPRLFIAGAVAMPLLLASLVVTNTMVYRGTTFGLGFGFFGQPLFDRLKISDVRKWLDEKVPDWPRYLELRNSLLKGVPTNAQLTMTLLRIGEANKSPLPPPPPAVNAPVPTAKEGHEMAADVPPEYEAELKEHHDEIQQGDVSAEGGQDDDAASKTSKKKKPSRILGFFKGTVKAGTNTVLGTNAVKAEALRLEHARRKKGVVKKDVSREAVGDGPTSFHARLHGKKGLVLISTTSTTPCVSFERAWPATAKAAHAAYEKALEQSQSQSQGKTKGAGEDGEEGDGQESAMVKTLRETAEKARPTAEFSILVDDIVSLKKLGGLGWKTKIVVGWALESQVADGLEIETTDGKKHVITAMPRRDEVFNRLASLGKAHQWEAW